jgi:hypothetical protein
VVWGRRLVGGVFVILDVVRGSDCFSSWGWMGGGVIVSVYHVRTKCYDSELECSWAQ